MASLYDAGWRQGSFLRVTLTMSHYAGPKQDDRAAAPLTLARVASLFRRSRPPSEGIALRSEQHGLWVVVTQDCGLNNVDEDVAEPLIELRPVYDDGNGDRNLGLRSKELRLSPLATRFIQAQSPRIMISPEALTSCLTSCGGIRENRLTADDTSRLKIWLGKRYDWPAVPQNLVELGRAIADAVSKERNAAAVPGVRDLLWTAGPGDSPEYALYALIEDETSRDAVEEWLGSIALRIPEALGVAGVLQAATSLELSLQVIEESYSADVSDITWRRGKPDGAY